MLTGVRYGSQLEQDKPVFIYSSSEHRLVDLISALFTLNHILWLSAFLSLHHCLLVLIAALMQDKQAFKNINKNHCHHYLCFIEVLHADTIHDCTQCPSSCCLMRHHAIIIDCDHAIIIIKCLQIECWASCYLLLSCYQLMFLKLTVRQCNYDTCSSYKVESRLSGKNKR